MIETSSRRVSQFYEFFLLFSNLLHINFNKWLVASFHSFKKHKFGHRIRPNLLRIIIIMIFILQPSISKLNFGYFRITPRTIAAAIQQIFIIFNFFEVFEIRKGFGLFNNIVQFVVVHFFSQQIIFVLFFLVSQVFYLNLTFMTVVVQIQFLLLYRGTSWLFFFGRGLGAAGHEKKARFFFLFFLFGLVVQFGKGLGRKEFFTVFLHFSSFFLHLFQIFLFQFLVFLVFLFSFFQSLQSFFVLLFFLLQIVFVLLIVQPTLHRVQVSSCLVLGTCYSLFIILHFVIQSLYKVKYFFLFLYNSIIFMRNFQVFSKIPIMLHLSSFIILISINCHHLFIFN
ncbi:hypothetical protein PPERSA_11323 [Pseudocohnilembus persalinus]|uniref:Transmembrane protein n=1 Tax=Pseudocohnilembus persalinus TaxID=266149 RepID=A0A0V0QQ38_PSEPJ|nr:hypothetical protein PPERSA_11323 [Pseudocohnilembus persalinus]|eukprot:KRX04199.1 hypothetical protein PPERSA_11323 [Pseudocohnilembus persalinus]